MRKRTAWRVLIFVSTSLLALGGMIFSVLCGAVDVQLSEIISIIFGQTHDTPHNAIIWNIRLPRTIVAALVGINLSLAGALLQGVMRNPMADPHIIGVSSGAGFFGIMMLIVFPAYAHLLVPVAFVGAMLAAVIIYLLAWQKGISSMRIILSGVAVSALLNSGISALLTFYSDRVEGAISFMVGSLGAKSWSDMDTILPYTIIGIVLTLIGSHRLNIMMLGDTEAKSVGLNVEGYRLLFIAIGALLAASAVSIVGMLSFVGLIVPHAAKLLVGNDYRIFLPLSALLGIIVVTVCDTISRIAFAPVELPVGIAMGVLGAPFFLYLLRKKAR